jgi:DNA-binding beta-propeller fold protein YncE
MKNKLVLALLFLGVLSVFSQTTLTNPNAPVNFGASSNASVAEQEFRRGIQAYHRGAFNEAILLFERSLAMLPGEALILDWLGNAYFRSGMEGAALQQWEYAADSGYGGVLLQQKIETIRNRRFAAAFRDVQTKYTEAGSFSGNQNNTLIFNQPVSVLSNPDGSFWAVAYTSNEVLRLDMNGLVLNRVRGSLTAGFSRPMDIARMQDGSLVVSEFFGDRLSLLTPQGQYVRSFGNKGRGQGQLMGPQYLALDSFDNIYVTDFGNARVVVFDRDGNGLFSFGGKSPGFPGFKAPTGIAIIHDDLYVADAVSGAIYRFDRSGNYMGVALPEKTFVRPEGMRNFGDYLLLADSNRLFSIDTATGMIFENARTGNAPSRLTSLSADVNGNILASDFQSNEIYLMSRIDELVGGLFVRIDQVRSDNFPEIILEVSVENQNRQPVVGLKEVNFLVTEEKRVAGDQRFLGAASNNQLCDITIVLDRSPQTSSYAEEVNAAVRGIAEAMNGQGTLRIVSAGNIPAPEYTGNPRSASAFSTGKLLTPVSPDCKIDLGIRLAANDLINAEKKRAIVYITAGAVAANAFSVYGLTDLTAYLNNNHIGFFSVNVTQGALPEELDYITNRTAGKGYYVYRPEGLAPLVQDILNVPNGQYRLAYTSSLPTDFGRAFLPVEVETYHLNRSGRDESGYFAPLQ